MTCGVCDGPTVNWVDMPIDAKKDQVTPFRQAIRCTLCGTGTIEPKPTRADVPAFYEELDYYTHGGSHMRDVKPRFFDKVLTKLAWWSDKAEPFEPAQLTRLLGRSGKVLDIGCGHGRLLAELMALGHDVLGVDPDPVAIMGAARAGVTVLQGTGENLPEAVPDASFDLVVMSHSLEHCIDPAAALRGARSKIRPGGLLYVEVPNSGCVHFQTMLGCSENFDSPRHLWFFTAKGLAKLIDTIELKPVGWRYHGLTRHHDVTWRGWETMIADRMARHGFGWGRRHGYARSVAMLVHEAFVPPLRKYDAIGILAGA